MCGAVSSADTDTKYGGGGQASGVHGFHIAPAGWMRFALDTSQFSSVPLAEWSTWHKAYHGTAGANVTSIVRQGLKFMPQQHGGAGKKKGKPLIYASPSIEYSAHYVYVSAVHASKYGTESAVCATTIPIEPPPTFTRLATCCATRSLT